MEHFGERNRNNEGRNLLDVCVTDEWVICSGLFEKVINHEIIRCSWDGKWPTVIDYVIMAK
jgi:hypothetical protein